MKTHELLHVCYIDNEVSHCFQPSKTVSFGTRQYQSFDTLKVEDQDLVQDLFKSMKL